MKVQVMSDLHVNQHGFRETPFPVISHKADVLVLAGDVLDLKAVKDDRFISWYKSIEIPIIYVLGNHEYDRAESVWGLPNIYRQYLLSINPLTYLLEDQVVTIEDVTFIGATLFSKLDPLKEFQMRKHMNHTLMPSNLTGPWWSVKFNNSKKFLEKALAEKASGKTFVVTHFGPSFQSVDEKYRGYATNVYFFSDLDDLIHIYQPRYWVHGHTHSPTRYNIGKTEIVCNPYGYMFRGDRENLNFNQELILEI